MYIDICKGCLYLFIPLFAETDENRLLGDPSSNVWELRRASTGNMIPISQLFPVRSLQQPDTVLNVFENLNSLPYCFERRVNSIVEHRGSKMVFRCNNRGQTYFFCAYSGSA